MKKILFATAAALLMLGSCNQPSGDNQNAIENIMTRTSIRKFKNQPVEQEKIDILLKAAMAAPTAVNLQPWHFIVIDDKATIRMCRQQPRTCCLPPMPWDWEPCGPVSIPPWNVPPKWPMC